MVFLIVLCVACGSKKPNDVLAKNEMITVLSEIAAAEVFVQNFVQRDTSKKFDQEIFNYYEGIFKKHKTSSANFYKSVDYYMQNPDEFKAMLDNGSVRIRGVKMQPVPTTLQ
jgi:hypothetical protein